MRTTIDAAGRIVVPKAMRDAMKLEAGRVVDIVFVDGRIEIEPAPAEVMLEAGGELPVLRPVAELPPLTDAEVREALDATRR